MENIIEIWKISLKFGKYHEFEKYNEIGKYHKFEKCHWNLENIIEIRYHGNNYLNNEETSIAMNYIAEHQRSCFSLVLKYQAKSAPFQDYMFRPEALKDPLTWLNQKIF